MDGPHSDARGDAPWSAGGRTAQASGHCGDSASRKIHRFLPSEHVHQWLSPEPATPRGPSGSGARRTANFRGSNDADREHTQGDEVDRAQALLVEKLEG